MENTTVIPEETAVPEPVEPTVEANAEPSAEMPFEPPADSPAEPSAEPVKTKRNLSVVSQYRNELFGLSILGIVVFHFCEAVLLTKNPAADYARDFAQVYNRILSSSGVEVFLFLSGMGLTFSMKKNSNLLRFYAKRFRRVLIPYLLFGLIYWVINDFFIFHTDVSQFLSDYLLISLWTQGVRRFWFVGLIMILYVVFPLFFKLFDTSLKRRRLLLAATVGLNVLICWLIEVYAPDVYGNIELAICRLPIFLLGVYYGEKIYRKDSFGWFEWIVIPCGLLLRTVTYLIRSGVLQGELFLNARYETAVFAFALLLVTVLLLDLLHCRPLNKALATVGTYSFELYITHVAVRNLMHQLGYPTYILWHYVICMAISVPLTIGLHKLTDVLILHRDRKAEKKTA